MVRHRTESEKNTIERSGGISFGESRLGRVVVTSVTVDAEGEKRIGKKKGTYITLTVPALTTDDDEGMR